MFQKQCVLGALDNRRKIPGSISSLPLSGSQGLKVLQICCLLGFVCLFLFVLFSFKKIPPSAGEGHRILAFKIRILLYSPSSLYLTPARSLTAHHSAKPFQTHPSPLRDRITPLTWFRHDPKAGFPEIWGKVGSDVILRRNRCLP